GVDVGAIEQRLIGGRVIAFYALDQLVLPHHAGLRRHSLFCSVFNGLRNDIETPSERGTDARLVLHARQVGGGTCHKSVLEPSPESSGRSKISWHCLMPTRILA